MGKYVTFQDSTITGIGRTKHKVNITRNMNHRQEQHEYII